MFLVTFSKYSALFLGMFNFTVAVVTSLLNVTNSLDVSSDLFKDINSDEYFKTYSCFWLFFFYYLLKVAKLMLPIKIIVYIRDFIKLFFIILLPPSSH